MLVNDDHSGTQLGIELSRQWGQHRGRLSLMHDWRLAHAANATAAHSASYQEDTWLGKLASGPLTSQPQPSPRTGPRLWQHWLDTNHAAALLSSNNGDQAFGHRHPSQPFRHEQRWQWRPHIDQTPVPLAMPCAQRTPSRPIISR